MVVSKRTLPYLIIAVFGVAAALVLLYFVFIAPSGDVHAQSGDGACTTTERNQHGWSCHDAYNGLLLKPFYRKVNWNDAEAVCLDAQQQDAHLAAVTDALQDDAIANLIRTENSSYCSHFWLGAYSSAETLRWTYDYDIVTNTSEYASHKIGRGLGPNQRIAIDAATLKWVILDQAESTVCFICAWNPASSLRNATDCDDLKAYGKHRSGLYSVADPSALDKQRKILCEMETSDGGWTVFQQRIDGSLSFWNESWNAYRDGFGEPGTANEFWAGNELLHQLTARNAKNSTDRAASTWLRVELWGDRNPNSIYADDYRESEYQEFSVGDEAGGYVLHAKQHYGAYLGNASMTWFDVTFSSGHQFSTVDRINDPETKCVTDYHLGGWWLHYCTFSSLNGEYVPPNEKWGDGYGMMWIIAGKTVINPRKSRMMLRKAPPRAPN